MLRDLMHPSIVNIKYAFQDESNLYMATEYVKGGDLSYYIYVKKVKFKEEQAKFIIANIVCALEFVHGNGVIHRDIRPDNLLFDENGWLQLTDFGLSRSW